MHRNKRAETKIPYVESIDENGNVYYEVNPLQARFTYDLVLLGDVNDAPEFTSLPVVETFAGDIYDYQTSAVDPELDALTYNLISGPGNMTISATGLTTWTPGVGDVGTYSLTMAVQPPKAEHRIDVSAE